MYFQPRAAKLPAAADLSRGTARVRVSMGYFWPEAPETAINVERASFLTTFVDSALAELVVAAQAELDRYPGRLVVRPGGILGPMPRESANLRAPVVTVGKTYDDLNPNDSAPSAPEIQTISYMTGVAVGSLGLGGGVAADMAIKHKQIMQTP